MVSYRFEDGFFFFLITVKMPLDFDGDCIESIDSFGMDILTILTLSIYDMG